MMDTSGQRFGAGGRCRERSQERPHCTKRSAIRAMPATTGRKTMPPLGGEEVKWNSGRRKAWRAWRGGGRGAAARDGSEHRCGRPGSGLERGVAAAELAIVVAVAHRKRIHAMGSYEGERPLVAGTGIAARVEGLDGDEALAQARS